MRLIVGGVEQVATQLAKTYTQMLQEIEADITVSNS